MIIVTAGQGLGGDGYANAYGGPIEISGGTVKATGGNVLIDRGLEEPYDGADGVHTTNEVRVSGGTLIAQGGNTKMVTEDRALVMQRSPAALLWLLAVREAKPAAMVLIKVTK